MIVINEIPIRSDYKISHIINEDILTVTIDGIEEEFDFTGMPDGVLDDIEIDLLPLNPILNAVKELGVLTIDLYRFYSFEEKYLFEEGVEPPVDEPPVDEPPVDEPPVEEPPVGEVGGVV